MIKQTALDQAGTAYETGKNVLKRLYPERVFNTNDPELGKAAFKEQGQRHPEGVRALVDERMKIPLTPERKAALEALKADPAAKAAIYDVWPRVLQFLDEVRDAGFIKAVRKNFFPYGRRTIGNWIQAFADQPPEVLAELHKLQRISDETGIPLEEVAKDPTAQAIFIKEGANEKVLGNLQYSRALDATSTELPTDVFLRYMDQVINAQTTKRLDNQVVNKINSLEMAKKNKEAAVFRRYLTTNIRKARSAWDDWFFKGAVEDVIRHQYKEGDTFTAPPEAPAAYQGTIKIENIKNFEEKGKPPRQEISISINGKPYPEKMSRYSVLAIEHAKDVLNTKPASTVVGKILRAEGTWVLAGRVKSLWNSVFGNTSRTISEFPLWSEDLRTGVKAAINYWRGKTPMERVQFYRDRGLLNPLWESGKSLIDQEGVPQTETSIAGDLARNFKRTEKYGKKLDLFSEKVTPVVEVTMSHLSKPDEFQKITVYESAAARARKNNPHWTPEQVDASAMYTTSLVTDLQMQAMRPGLTGNPMYDAYRFMKTSGLRTFHLLSKQIAEAARNPTPENLYKPVAHTGLYVGQFMVLYALFSEMSDAKMKDKLKQKAMDMTGPVGDAVIKGQVPLPTPRTWKPGVLETLSGNAF